MRRLTILAVGLAALALAGCGGGGNKASSNTTTTTETTTNNATTTGTSTTSSSNTTTEAGGSTTPNFASGKCKNLAQSAAKIGQDIGASGASGNLQNVAKEFQGFVSVVPSEIKGDVQTIADAFTAYANALKGVNLSSGQVPSAADLQKMQDALKSFDQQKVRAAERHIEAWTKRNC
jgi:hypothetical protein